MKKKKILNSLEHIDDAERDEILLSLLKKAYGDKYRQQLATWIGEAYLVATGFSVICSFVNPEDAETFANQLSKLINSPTFVVTMNLNSEQDVLLHAEDFNKRKASREKLKTELESPSVPPIPSLAKKEPKKKA